MAVFPHGSVAMYVLVVVSVHPTKLVTSLTKVTVGAPQPSDVVTDAVFGAGTAMLHPANVTFDGHVMVGGVTSTVLVMVWLQVLEFPQPSVAR